MKELIFIVGPTAAGKTVCAYQLACQLNASIVSADAMLVYKEPAIITNAPDQEILKKVKHYFVRQISARKPYNVFAYYKAATKIIKKLSAKQPIIVCGGSGLYVKALLDGIFEGVGTDLKLRKELQTKDLSSLYQELKRLDPESAKKISANDQRRIIRALEVFYLSKSPLSQKKKTASGLAGERPVKIFGLNLKRQQLYDRINQRVETMFEQGAASEVKRLLKLKLSLTAQKIIGVYEITNYLKGVWSLQQAKDEMKKNTRRFAKRQLTWFRADKRIEWIEVDKLTAKQIAGEIYERINTNIEYRNPKQIRNANFLNTDSV